MICPRSHSWWTAEVGFEPSLLVLHYNLSHYSRLSVHASSLLYSRPGFGRMTPSWVPMNPNKTQLHGVVLKGQNRVASGPGPDDFSQKANGALNKAQVRLWLRWPGSPWFTGSFSWSSSCFHIPWPALVLEILLSHSVALGVKSGDVGREWGQKGRQVGKELNALSSLNIFYSLFSPPNPKPVSANRCRKTGQTYISRDEQTVNFQ
jgi:hypothetical protein